MIGQESESSTVQDCKHFEAPDWCKLFIVDIDFIAGRDLIVHATKARRDWSMCGGEAKLFEPTWFHKFTNKVFK